MAGRRKKPYKGLPAPNRVINIEKDGEYLTVQFVRENGELVIGEYRLIGWGYGPSEELAKVNRVLNSLPSVTYGSPPAGRGGQARQRRAPAGAGSDRRGPS